MTLSGSPSEGLLLVGHGSQSPRNAAEMREIAALVAAALPGVTVGLGSLELSDPPAGRTLDALAASGCDRVVVLPLVLLAAGHSKSDVPALVLEGRARHPGVEIVFGRPLGLARELVDLLGGAIVRGGGGGRPFLLIGRGTSDPDANGDVHKACRLVGEFTGAPFVHTAFTGVTVPGVAQALDVFDRLGYREMAVAFWFLCHGRLVARTRLEIEAFARRTGCDVVDGGYLGAHRRIVPVILEAYNGALGGAAPAANCDLCAYRAPWPGLEDRVGRPI
ncbi:MAG: sirohydrochlorin chelatase, partial [Acidimicrobiia bacterium]